MKVALAPLVALLLASAALAADVPVRLPAGEDLADWEHALGLVGLEVSSGEPDAAPWVVIDEVDGSTWLLVAVDLEGTERRTEIAAPRGPEDREGIAFLASSLLEVVQLPALELPTPARPSPTPPGADVEAAPPVSTPPPSAVVVGIGLVVGAPTGVSVKAELDRVPWFAVDAAAGSVLPGPAAHVTALLQASSPLGGTGLDLGAYVGAGGCLRQRRPGLATRPGLRVPVGLQAHLREVHLGLFVEGAAVALSGPWWSSDLELATGVRWFARIGRRKGDPKAVAAALPP